MSRQQPSEAFNLKRLIEEGREHWKLNRPREFKRLTASKKLEPELKKAATETRALLDQMSSVGMTDAEAWPEVRGQFLILPPEGDSAAADEQ